MTTEEIERELRAMRPDPDPDFARRLDEWAAADFPAGAGLGPHLAQRARATGPFRRAWDRLSATPPRRILMPVGAAVTAVVAVALVISNGGSDVGDTDSSLPSAASSAKAPPATGDEHALVAPDS